MKNELNIKEKEKVTYTKEMLIKKIASSVRKNISTVRIVYNALEQIITDCLSTTSPDVDVMIRLFEGISIDSTFIPEKTKLNNLTGETIITTSKIKPKANITRSYCEKLSANIN